MKLQVELLSKEFMKPSSPTPKTLRHYQLSFLDQIAPHHYNPMVYFFAPKLDSTEISTQLKESLSNILTHYYPFAGRIRDDKFIDCNDEGIPYVETRVNIKLNDFLDDPAPGELNKLLPFKLRDAAESNITLGVQLNVFGCGGIAIGVCTSHKIADALSLTVFLSSWAAMSRGEVDFGRPNFVSATLFPPKTNTCGYDPDTYITKSDTITKRFVFCASATETLKAKYVDNIQRLTSLENKFKRPSRVEALTAFIWGRFLAAIHGDGLQAAGTNNLYALIHNVNLRPKIDPPQPEYSFGNFSAVVAQTVTVPPSFSTTGSQVEYNALASRQLMEKLKRIDKNYINKIREGGEEYMIPLKEASDLSSMTERVQLEFTSLCKFPLYDTDFGWGKPIWVGMAACAFENFIILLDNKLGDGIEAYIALKTADMFKLEQDKEFLAYVSPTGSKLLKACL
ncbi:Vinorine synthase-like [Quillaja saponaria]|uniref:Vinorine synthase-like n=1 Tax=Quillaja saponaria TaxID=32244 RepID=A0AAD7PP95_QUISA|nr:Vinorine synthase-like [Quillaja saponaria]